MLDGCRIILLDDLLGCLNCFGWSMFHSEYDVCFVSLRVQCFVSVRVVCFVSEYNVCFVSVRVGCFVSVRCLF